MAKKLNSFLISGLVNSASNSITFEHTAYIKFITHLLSMTKIMELAHLEDVHFGGSLFSSK